MKILVEMGHPAHVHFFRNAVKIWKNQGHELSIVSREKELTNYLLRAYGIDAVSISKAGHGAVGLFKEMLWRDYKLWKLSCQFKPDIMTSIGGTWISQVSKLIKKPAVVFYDTENATISNTITYPLVAALCTPKCYQMKTRLGIRHLRYPGYHELAYLHPNYFQPDEHILSAFHLRPSDRYFIVRFISWGASHDLREKGIRLKDKIKLIELLSGHGRVFITSEDHLPPELQKYSSSIPPEHIHDLMAYADMVVGESATMASEAAVLGIPAIFISDTGRGYTSEQERYGLVYHFTNKEIGKAFEVIDSLIRDPGLRAAWQQKRKTMLLDCIDVTSFIVDFINGYPESLYRYHRIWRSLQNFDPRRSHLRGN
jgi:predicted glycosyltransferase